MGDAVLRPHGVKEEECISASLDLWSGVEVETAYDQVYWQIYHPEAPMEKSANTINFRLASHDDYTDLHVLTEGYVVHPIKNLHRLFPLLLFSISSVIIMWSFAELLIKISISKYRYHKNSRGIIKKSQV